MVGVHSVAGVPAWKLRVPIAERSRFTQTSRVHGVTSAHSPTAGRPEPPCCCETISSPCWWNDARPGSDANESVPVTVFRTASSSHVRLHGGAIRSVAVVVVEMGTVTLPLPTSYALNTPVASRPEIDSAAGGSVNAGAQPTQDRSMWFVSAGASEPKSPTQVVDGSSTLCM